MAIQDQWKELNNEIQNDENHILKDIVETINDSLRDPKEEDVKSLNDKFDEIEEELKKLYKKTKYSQVEKTIKTYINDIRDTVYRKKGIKLSKWDAFVLEAKRYNWECVLELIDLVNIIDNSSDEKVEDYVKRFEQKYKEDVMPFIERNLSPFNKDLVKREFNKKQKGYANLTKKNDQENFGALLKHLRLSKGYALEDVGRLSGVSASYIHLLEKGQRQSPTLETVEKLAEGLEVPVQYFFKNRGQGNGANDTAMTGFAEMVILQNFTLNGKKASKKQKEAIVSLFNGIMKAEWTPETKLAESMELIQKIEEFISLMD
ncbi:helix-turn-helix domain-containing protein [Bacillus cereus]|uniref:helix-turn-helix domain-containing protein n=1 Tax=Bacillus cereus TaxID=1396 RepID=UPI000BFC2F1A|nr:helix-turn-helix transcriptional regulator [Bacillus cereus]PGW13455.1 hypothetical protein COD97_08815 [Bacillus cereus]